MSARIPVILAVLLCYLGAGTTQAGVYSRVDPVSGMVVVSNVPAPGAVPAPAPGKSGGGAATAFPRVSSERQKQLDETRRDILEAELGNEQKALDVAERSRVASDIVQRHIANVEALKRELAGLR